LSTALGGDYGLGDAALDAGIGLVGLGLLGDVVGLRKRLFKGRRAQGAASGYADITRRSRGKASVWNRATDVPASEFGDNLLEAGFKRTSPEEGIQVFTRGDRKYVTRGPEHSGHGWTADVFIDGEQVGKIRLGGSNE